MGRKSKGFLLQKGVPERSPSHIPRLLTVKGLSPSAIEVNWEYPFYDMIDGYLIHYRLSTTAGDYKVIRSMGGNNYVEVLTHLLPNSVYEIKVQAFNVDGMSGFSDITTAKTFGKETDSVSISTLPPFPDFDLKKRENKSSGERNVIFYVIIGSVCCLVLVVCVLCFVCYCRGKKSPPVEDKFYSFPPSTTRTNVGVSTGNGYARGVDHDVIMGGAYPLPERRGSWRTVKQRVETNEMANL